MISYMADYLCGPTLHDFCAAAAVPIHPLSGSILHYRPFINSGPLAIIDMSLLAYHYLWRLHDGTSLPIPLQKIILLILYDERTYIDTTLHLFIPSWGCF